MLVKGETMTLQEFGESLTKKKLTKEQKKALADKAKALKRKLKEQAKKERKKKQKIIKNNRAKGIMDFSYEIGENKNVGKFEFYLANFEIVGLFLYLR